MPQLNDPEMDLAAQFNGVKMDACGIGWKRKDGRRRTESDRLRRDD